MTIYTCPSCGVGIASRQHPELEGKLCAGCVNLGHELVKGKAGDPDTIKRGGVKIHDARPTREV